MKAYLFLCLSLFISFASQAQSEVEMADQFRADGKIYVVVAIILVILIGLFTYLFRLGHRISQIEKALKKDA